MSNVIINVSGGVAEVVQGNAAIIDWDELMDEHSDTGYMLTSLRIIRSMKPGPVKDNMMSSLIDAADHHPKCYWVYVDGDCEELSKRFNNHADAVTAGQWHHGDLFTLNAEDSSLYIEPVI